MAKCANPNMPHDMKDLLKSWDRSWAHYCIIMHHVGSDGRGSWSGEVHVIYSNTEYEAEFGRCIDSGDGILVASDIQNLDDPQRRMSPGLPPRYKRANSFSSRTGFTFHRIAKVILCWTFQLIFIGPMVPIHFNFTAQDFAPSRKVFFRRLLPLYNNYRPITFR
ncbi:oxidoreductase [Aspergillus luchuensis]|uniref:Oxidoreductase n=1 Tax=Aspergillus kawachii TaxID=1069201 RepID=A0A146FLM9_ASPKA|nr:oxidoreductase [Aspergillus luchuensis]